MLSGMTISAYCDENMTIRTRSALATAQREGEFRHALDRYDCQAASYNLNPCSPEATIDGANS